MFANYTFTLVLTKFSPSAYLLRYTSMQDLSTSVPAPSLNPSGQEDWELVSSCINDADLDLVDSHGRQLPWSSGKYCNQI